MKGYEQGLKLDMKIGEEAAIKILKETMKFAGTYEIPPAELDYMVAMVRSGHLHFENGSIKYSLVNPYMVGDEMQKLVTILPPTNTIYKDNEVSLTKLNSVLTGQIEDPEFFTRLIASFLRKPSEYIGGMSSKDTTQIALVGRVLFL